MQLFNKFHTASLVMVFMASLCLPGCQRQDQVGPVERLAVFTSKVDSWRPSDYDEIYSLFAASPDAERQAMRSHLMREILAEGDFKRARALFSAVRCPDCIKDVARQDLQAMMDHLNRLAEQQGHSNRLLLRMVDGSVTLSEKRSIH